MPMTPYDRLGMLEDHFDEALAEVRDLLDELDALGVLREHVPASRQYQVDRLETALRLAARLDNEIEFVDWEIGLMEEERRKP